MSQVFDPNAVVMQAVWLIDRNGSNGFTDPLITADSALLTAAATAAQRPSVFYLPIELADGNPLAGLDNLYRGNSGLVYSKRLDGLGFQLEETLGTSWRDAVDDTVQLLLSPQRGSRSRPTSLRRSIMTHSEAELGYGWRTRQEAYFIPSIPLVISSAGQTNTITFDERSGGQLTDWRVEIPASGIDEQIVNVGESYGRSFQVDFNLTEELVQPGQFASIPTQGGDEFSIAKRFPSGNAFPWEYQAAPVLDKLTTINADGTTSVSYTVFPLLFLPQNHGTGGLHKPAAYLRSTMRSKWTFNWNGREGVHQWECDYFNPFDIPLLVTGPAPGPIQILMSMNLYLRDAMVDQIWIYDAANDTEHHAVEDVEAPGYDGGEDNTANQLTLDFWGTSFGLKTPNPCPSGIGGVIFRDSGTFWGDGQDFAIGQYTSIIKTASSKFKRNIGWGYQCNYTTDGGQPGGRDGLLGHFLRTGNVSNGGHAANTLLGPLRSYLVMGTFAQVKSKMRQLFLDGVQ